VQFGAKPNPKCTGGGRGLHIQFELELNTNCTFAGGAKVQFELKLNTNCTFAGMQKYSLS